ncbi:aminotransferase class I/II-fold pyridoxal phosphate-dependent enzyme [Ginsengibacter hankyongi]|uniref:Aminotransferase class I/II-fold pyridoxal phosphate-dependent enzyme n=1 Tax=Ginsengibacter hankyongi TaxID=2607284 RepID=A0A5J5IMK8_9BACT|nr:aminotransferase class I/II-fold pyridoxal phosphate-dependent enzyme [Ginsengibacter hankyongi]
MSIKSKLPNTGQTIFSVMSSLAVKHNAINLGQGFPDFPMNETLIDLVNTAMKNNHNQYVHMDGLISLRESISEKISFLYQKNINPETEITITPGATYAIYTALTSVLQQDDEVIVFEPAYDSYIPNIEINGAKAIKISLQYPDYKINWMEVKENISDATRMIIINSPNNPTGNILEANDLLQLQTIVSGTGILIMSDEVYEHIVFDGRQHASILKYPDLFNRSFISFSFGKVYNCTGWKIGYCIAPAYLMNEFRKVHQFNCFSCNSPVQFALAEFLKEKKIYLELGNILQQKRDFFYSLMKETKFKALPSQGSYFQLYNYSEVSELSEIDFAKLLTEKARVATIPLSSFYRASVDKNVLRFCFAKKESTLTEAVERLLRFNP